MSKKYLIIAIIIVIALAGLMYGSNSSKSFKAQDKGAEQESEVLDGVATDRETNPAVKKSNSNPSLEYENGFWNDLSDKAKN